MTYLSRLLLNPQAAVVRRDLVDCQGMHRTLLRAFPAVPEAEGHDRARAHYGVLYRIDAASADSIRLLVQSRTEPAWDALPDGYLCDTGGSPLNPSCKPIGDRYAQLAAGQSLIFRLRANPTKRIGGTNQAEGEGWHGKRVELRCEEDLLAWLRRKGANHGFRPLAVRTAPDIASVSIARGAAVHGGPQAPGILRGRHRAGPLTFGTVVFDGTLQITDADCFRGALEQGIGSGKAYGFGLLSLASLWRGGGG